MPITLQESAVIADCRTIPFDEFPRWHAHHLRLYPDTPNLEKEASALIGGEWDFQQIEKFIRGVCRWGGYAGIGGRVINQNQESEIIRHFRDAINTLSSGGVATALRKLNNLKGLGTPSFASKHLRFLRPDICPILDRLQAPSLVYPFSPSGYQQLAKDCLLAAGRLNSSNVPLSSGKAWGAAEVEMSIFACLHLRQKHPVGCRDVAHFCHSSSK